MMNKINMMVILAVVLGTFYVLAGTVKTGDVAVPEDVSALSKYIELGDTNTDAFTLSRVAVVFADNTSTGDVTVYISDCGGKLDTAVTNVTVTGHTGANILVEEAKNVLAKGIKIKVAPAATNTTSTLYYSVYGAGAAVEAEK